MTKTELINHEFQVSSRVMLNAATAYATEVSTINLHDGRGSWAIAEAYARLHSTAQAEAIGWAARSGEG